MGRAMIRRHSDEERLRAGIAGRALGVGALHCFDCVDSTIDVAFALEREGAPNRSVVMAREQKRGRGRFDRNWYSAPGGLYASIILKDFLSEIPYSMAAALGVCRILRDLGANTTLKWINDVLCDDKRKIAGVLVEERPGCTVIGIGVNLSTERFPPELKECATSLFLETGKRMDAVEFMSHLLIGLLPLIDRAHHDIELVLSEWEEESAMRGRHAEVVGDFGTRRGVIQGVNRRTGALLLSMDGRITETYEGSLFYTE
jgi:BirA family biotin operon repressor/biotin-[acetyl-CoA-carboxylase] ligase